MFNFQLQVQNINKLSKIIKNFVVLHIAIISLIKLFMQGN